MKRVHRLALTIVGAAIVAAVTTATAFGAGYLGPGHYVSNFADASAQWFSTGFTNVSVDRNTFVFRGHGGTSFMQHATILIVQVKSPTVLGDECFVIPDQDFVESNGVQAASLNAIGDTSNLCPGFATPLSSVLKGSGTKGGPGPGGNLVLPLTVNLSWTGNGVTATSSGVGRFDCAGFSSVNQSHSMTTLGAATGTLTFGDGTVMSLAGSDFGSIDSGSDMSDLQGTPSAQCLGK